MGWTGLTAQLGWTGLSGQLVWIDLIGRLGWPGITGRVGELMYLGIDRTVIPGRLGWTG